MASGKVMHIASQTISTNLEDNGGVSRRFVKDIILPDSPSWGGDWPARSKMSGGGLHE